VLDEADQMAGPGFLPVVRQLLEATPREGQRLLFSATLDGEVNVPEDRLGRRSTVAQGTVQWFSTDKGYGFITPDDGTPDVFVHHSAIKAGGYRGLQDNQRVEFIASQGVKGPRADEVRPI